MTLLEDGDPEISENRVKDLMDVVVSYIPQQERLVDRSFLMPTKDVFSISGRGMVVTGRVERDVVNMGWVTKLKSLTSVRRRRRQ